MNLLIFVSDLHGMISRYKALVEVIQKEKPDFVLIGGDLLPHKGIVGRPGFEGMNDFITDFMIPTFSALRKKMECAYPEILLIPGNDDPVALLNGITEGEKDDLWVNLHNTYRKYGKYTFYGYSFVPPTPFRLKDWERYDVDFSTPPGSLSPEEGYFSSPGPTPDLRRTLSDDLEQLAVDNDLEFGIFLFHTPPYGTSLDLIERNTESIEDETPGIHVGSKAVQNFITKYQPYITLHGHIHESVRVSGKWQELSGRTFLFGAAHHGPELALIKFELHTPRWAERTILAS